MAARSQAPAARIGSAGGNAAIARFIRAGATMVQRDGPAAATPALPPRRPRPEPRRHAISAAAGHAETVVVERSEHGTLLRAGAPGRPAAACAPAASGRARRRAVGRAARLPPGSRGHARPRARARERLAPLTLIRLLANQATPDGLPQLQGEPAIEARPGGAWRARFATVAHVRDGRLVVCDWHAELSATGRLAWWMTERR